MCGVTVGAHAIAARLRANLDGLVTVHRVHQDEIDVTGDEAVAVFAMDDIVIHPSPSDARVGIHGHGRYHDRFIRTAGGWRLAEMRLERLAVLPLPGGHVPVPDADPRAESSSPAIGDGHRGPREASVWHRSPGVRSFAALSPSPAD